jgi:hypothetical protein
MTRLRERPPTCAYVFTRAGGSISMMQRRNFPTRPGRSSALDYTRGVIFLLRPPAGLHGTHLRAATLQQEHALLMDFKLRARLLLDFSLILSRYS